MPSPIRPLVARQLTALGWRIDDTPPAAAPTSDFILHGDDASTPLAIIALKTPPKTLRQTLDHGLATARAIACPTVFATDGSLTLTAHTGNGKPLIMGGEEVRELLGAPLLRHFIATNIWARGGVVKNSAQLARLFTQISKLLLKEGLQQMDAFVEFSQLFFLKLTSERHTAADWHLLKTQSGTRLLHDYQTTLRTLEKSYPGVFTRSEIRNPLTLEQIITHLDRFSFVDAAADIKGEAYEYFLRQYNKKRNELAQYFTPRHIVAAMVKFVNPQIGEKIYDPFCGTGGMLIESYRHIARAIATEPDLGRRRALEHTLRQNTLYGNDISRSAAAAKMNMILAGDGHSNITRTDSLNIAFPDGGRYHAVITNIPFSRDLEHRCIAHCLDSVAGMPGARVCIIVPERIINADEYRPLRRDLLNTWRVHRVLSLPREVFRGFTTAKTSIIYATRQTAPRPRLRHPISHIAIKNDGYTPDKRRDLLAGQNDLDIALEQRHDRLSAHHIHHADSTNHYALSPTEAITVTSPHPLATLGDVVTLIERKITITDDMICREPAMDGKTHRLLSGGARAGYNVDVKNRLKIQTGDLVMAKMHTQNGLFAIADGEYHSTGSHLSFRLDDQKIDRDYLFWTLHFVVPHLGKTDTTGRESYTLAQLLSLPIPLPPLPQQKTLVAPILKSRQQAEAALLAHEQAKQAFHTTLLPPKT